MAQNRHIYALFGLSTATPKPRAEGSSPSAPAKLKSPKNGLNKPFFGLLFWIFSLENLTARGLKCLFDALNEQQKCIRR